MDTCGATVRGRATKHASRATGETVPVHRALGRRGRTSSSDRRQRPRGRPLSTRPASNSSIGNYRRRRSEGRGREVFSVAAGAMSTRVPSPRVAAVRRVPGTAGQPKPSAEVPAGSNLRHKVWETVARPGGRCRPCRTRRKICGRLRRRASQSWPSGADVVERTRTSRGRPGPVARMPIQRIQGVHGHARAPMEPEGGGSLDDGGSHGRRGSRAH
jgi:hypothetical protein